MDALNKFDLLLSELGLKKSSSRCVELSLEEDIAARITLHPNDKAIVVTLYFYDVSNIEMTAKRNIYESLLLLNNISSQQGSCYVGMDSREFLTLIGLVALEDLTEEMFLARLHHLDNQAVLFKELIEAMRSSENSRGDKERSE